MKKIINIIIICCLFGLNISASEVTQAEAAYNSGNYSEAIEHYKTAIEAEGVSGELYYDLGNAYYKAGNLGGAVLSYERAKRLNPGNKYIENNLNFVSAKVVDANKAEAGEKKNGVEYDEPTFMKSLNKMIAENRSSDSWAVFAVIAFFLFLGFAAMYCFTPNVLARKTGFFSGIIFLGFSVVFLIFAFMSASYARSSNQAVVIEAKTKLMEKPEEDSKAISTPLKDGTKVEILESSEANGVSPVWFKVKLNSRNIGWLKSNTVEII